MKIAWENGFVAIGGGDFEKIYVKPWCRVIVYAFGLGVSFLLHTYKTHKKTGEIYDEFAFALVQIVRKMQIVRVIMLLVGFCFFVMLVKV